MEGGLIMEKKGNRKVDISEELAMMQGFLESLPHKIFIKDKNLKYLFCNRNYAEDLGIGPEAIKGKADFEFYPRELAEKYRADDQRILDSGKTEEIEEKYVMDDEEYIVETFKTPLLNSKGKVAGILGFFRDITQFKRSEERVARQNATLNAINKIFRESLTCLTEADLGKSFLAAAETVTQSSFGFIGEVNGMGRFDTIALSDPGWKTCVMPKSDATVLIRDMEIRGLWGKVIKDNQSMIANDPSSHPDRVGIPSGHPELKSFLGVPLKRGEKVIGMIALGNKKDGYTRDDKEAIESLSSAMVEILVRKRAENKLSQQAQEILDLSTPVIQVLEGIVVAPLIGLLDSQRTQGFMERFLNGIVEYRSPVALVDITGVPAIDTQTAQHLIEAITAARLLGTRVILTGVRPAIAQTLVHLGIDLSDIDTRASLSGGLRLAMDILGLNIVKKESTK
jgi:PAS domain S-box-containing protein